MGDPVPGVERQPQWWCHIDGTSIHRSPKMWLSGLPPTCLLLNFEFHGDFGVAEFLIQTPLSSMVFHGFSHSNADLVQRISSQPCLIAGGYI